ncbi:hypothetical protein N7492_002458 [Penicillium capsulatum]|uniref:Uncharacterized protein n=1 Tax=Penicillium capsulatum TaxID=69766 RepID=A0A9W9IHM1_9EURO|nr:hypothetical protein N7492_002458 [Penicillium capsulatum]KAJ6122937.1 hypothetical protein N7512_005402 [Penicillium capsulatum]
MSPSTKPNTPPSGSSTAGDSSPEINPFLPNPAYPGEIYTGKDWVPKPNLDRSQGQTQEQARAEYTPPAERVQSRQHISRWQQLKNTPKVSLAIIIFMVMVVIAMTVVIALMGYDVIKVAPTNDTGSTRNFLIGRQYAILPIDSQAGVSASPSFTPLPTVIPDSLPTETIVLEVSSSFETSLTVPAVLPTSHSVIASRNVTSFSGSSRIMGTAIKSSSAVVSNTTFITRTRTPHAPTRLPF